VPEFGRRTTSRWVNDKWIVMLLDLLLEKLHQAIDEFTFSLQVLVKQIQIRLRKVAEFS
jgi:hypothetical protein